LAKIIVPIFVAFPVPTVSFGYTRNGPTTSNALFFCVSFLVPARKTHGLSEDFSLKFRFPPW